MSNDVKLAILAGVALISAFAFATYKKDMSAKRAYANASTSNAFPPISQGRQSLSAPGYEAKTIFTSPSKRGYYHRVHPNDTVVGLAQRFYGDGDRFHEIIEANRSVISCPDCLPDGADIFIPGVDEQGRLLARR